jgi:uncharacterized protein YlxP (DUF503 family)
MVIGLLKIELYIESSRSLKDKRRIIKSLIQKLKSKYSNLSVSEIELLNNWKKSKIAIVTVSNEITYINSVLDKVLNYIIEGYNYQVVKSDIEILNY